MNNSLNQPKYRRTAGTVVVLAAMMITGSGCFSTGGDTVGSPTLGKQLQDLQTAHERHAITDAEYDRAKARLLGSDPQVRVESSAAGSSSISAK